MKDFGAFTLGRQINKISSIPKLMEWLWNGMGMEILFVTISSNLPQLQ